MTTRRPQSGWTALGLSVLLLSFGLGVAPASARERLVRGRSGTAATARTVARSSSAMHSSGHSRRSAHNTRLGSRTHNTQQVSHHRSSSLHHGGRQGGHHGHHRSSVSFHFGYGYGYYPYYSRYYHPYSYYGYYSPYYYSPYYSGYRRPYSADRYLGALDLNVKPKKAEVFVDGEYIGLVKDFDGFPGYLWLEKDTYDISFYLPGYQTLTRTFSVHPGNVVDVRLRLEAGEAVLPEKPEKPRERAANRPPARWRDRDSDRGRDYGRDRDSDGERPGRFQEQRREVEEEKQRDVRSEPGRLRLTIAPADATVYLDGRFLGSGEELGRLHAGLIVEPGEHSLEVLRPGFDSQRLEVRVGEGEEVELSVELTEG